jgi:hypothetical protein
MYLKKIKLPAKFGRKLFKLGVRYQIKYSLIYRLPLNVDLHHSMAGKLAEAAYVGTPLLFEPIILFKIWLTSFVNRG